MSTEEWEKTKIRCDKCKAIVSTDPKSLVTITLEKGVERTYFECKACGQPYTAFYTNKKIRDRILEIKGLDRVIAIKWNQRKDYKRESMKRASLVMANKKDMHRLRIELEGDKQ